MQEQFVPYDIALKLKGLGFNEKCLGFWNVSPLNSAYRELMYGMCTFKNTSVELSKYPENVLVPLWQQVEKWIFDNYKILICSEHNCDFTEVRYSLKYSIHTKYTGGKQLSYTREQAILTALEIINDQK